jgi:transcriptional regulator with AAA-type ATPase domain/tetratricopeptide (TPR) repeat protein
MGLLANLAGAADEPRANAFLEILEERGGQHSALLLAYEFYASHLALRHEEYGRAEEHCGKGRSLALKLGWEAEVAGFCHVLGTLQHKLGQYAVARRHFEEAIVAARRAGSRQLEGRATMNLGLVLKNTGELREAERLLRFSYVVALEGADQANTARCALNLTTVLIRRGSWHEALNLATNAAAQFDSLGLVGFANTARVAMARATRLLGSPQEALEILELALEEAKRVSKPRNVVLALEFIGDCEVDLGMPKSACDRYREALLLARGHATATDLVLECLRGLAMAELAAGVVAGAQQLLEESIDIAGTQGDSFELATSWLCLGKTLDATGQPSAASEAYAHACSLAASIGAEALFRESSGLRVAGINTQTPIRDAGARTPAPGDLIPSFLTVDPRVIRSLSTVVRLAPRRLNVLIHGESGTGKELIAQAVHSNSGRRGPFVPVNCSAFPGDLIEGELFGHARGAYTGADRERVGLFEHAHKGTLFLDEIGDMPVKAQARLLRALESGEVRRLGENTPRVVDVRVVSATHRDLMTMVGAGEFRLDLYYRLAGFVVELPPIRERIEDAKLLIDHYLAHFAKEQGKSITMTADLRQQLVGHSWPGNVREIRLVMDRLVSLSEDGAVLRSLPFALEGEPRPRSLPELLEAEEKRRILDALQSHNWNKQRAALTLGTNRTTLIGKMKRMGISARKP